MEPAVGVRRGAQAAAEQCRAFAHPHDPPPGTSAVVVRAAVDGTRVVFDHTGFAAKNEMLRTVTLRSAQMLLRLTEYPRTGTPVPFFDHD